MNRNHEIVTSSARLKELVDDYLNAKFIAVDTETNGLKIDRECIGISFAKSEIESFYVPLETWDNNKKEIIIPWDLDSLILVINYCRKLLQNKKNLIMHNAVFDIKTIENHFLINVLDYVFCDTMLLAHTVHNEEGPLGLKALAALLIDPNANNPQDDVKESVKANGGSITKNNFEMYKCDYEILGKYACYDVMYTFGLFNKLYPKLFDNNTLLALWNSEVMPLLEVSYELNTNGMKIDVDYFVKLKTEIMLNIAKLENDIYSSIRYKLEDYEKEKILKEVKITPRSEVGKILIQNFGDLENPTDGNKWDFVKSWYLNKNGVKELFNLDSTQDKGYLLYDILGLPITKRTKTGKPATDAKTLEELCENYKHDAPTIQLLLDRAKEIKLLSTYINPLLENQKNGYIYTGFKQCGTISGRFSSSDPINLQTLPRDDKRIKCGFIPDSNCVLIGADYSSLEPRSFSVVSNSWELQEIFRQNLDFYSKIAIDVLKLQGVSAKEEDDNFLKKVNPGKRQLTKAFALAVPYGAGPGRISGLVNVEYEEAKDLINNYLDTYPDLKQWMKDSEEKAIKQGFVETITGRRRNTRLVHKIHKRTGTMDFSKQFCEKLINRYGIVEGYEDGTELFLACRNELNNAKNFQIQGLAASIINQAMIKWQNEKKRLNLKSKLVLMVHDELIVQCPKEEIEIVKKVLQNCMECNIVTEMIDIPILAVPEIAENNLSETK